MENLNTQLSKSEQNKFNKAKKLPCTIELLKETSEIGGGELKFCEQQEEGCGKPQRKEIKDIIGKN